MNGDHRQNRKLSREYVENQVIEEEGNFQLQIQNMTKEELIKHVQQMDKKVKNLQQENSVQKGKIWDLRKLIKRVATEGYNQLIEVEKEKNGVEENLESLEKFYQSLDNNSKLFEQCIYYWSCIDENNFS